MHGSSQGWSECFQKQEGMDIKMLCRPILIGYAFDKVLNPASFVVHHFRHIFYKVSYFTVTKNNDDNF